MGDQDFQGVEALYETPETGNLAVTNEGKAFRVKPTETAYDGPSLAGPMPQYGHRGQTGLGGSIINPDDNGTHSSAQAVEQAYKPAEVALTPAQMLAMADQYESDMREAHYGRMAQGPAVSPSAPEQPHVPDWLEQYMDSQPATKPYSAPGGTTVVDRVMGNKYLSEQEKLRMLKHLQKK